jgi:hypothetical protein
MTLSRSPSVLAKAAETKLVPTAVIAQEDTVRANRRREIAFPVSLEAGH